MDTDYHVDLTGTDLNTVEKLSQLVPGDAFDIVGQEAGRLLSVQTSSYYAHLLEQRGAKLTSLAEMRQSAPPIA